jgi:hypothetical protein
MFARESQYLRRSFAIFQRSFRLKMTHSAPQVLALARERATGDKMQYSFP